MTALRYRKPKILSSIPRDRHAVIEASAGTGKTYTLEHLVADLVLSGVDISEILVVTYTRPATSELVGRVRGLLLHLLDLSEDASEGADDEACWILDEVARKRIEVALRRFDIATVATIHSFCQGILKEHAFSNQRLFSEEMVDSDEAFREAFQEEIRGRIAKGRRTAALLELWLMENDLSALEKLLFECSSARGRILPHWEDPEGGAGGEEAVVERMKDSIGKTTTLHALVVQEFLPLIRERLAAHKREAGLIDYEDMLSLLRDSLRGEHAPLLLAHLRTQYKYALIDEFQDTDELQWEIFRRIFFESEDEEGRPRNILYLIGDPKQAIYRFRGADVETYLQAKEKILEGGGEEVVLEQNFRSTGALIDAYNQIFEQDPVQPFFSHPKIRYENPVSCGQDELALLDAEGEPAKAVHVFEVKTPRGTRGPLRGAGLILPRLGRAIASQIRSITDPATPSLRMRNQKKEVSPIELREIYILCNSNGEARRMGGILREEGIPYAFFKQDGLFQTEEARAILDLLRAIADPADDAKRMQAWLTPFFPIPMAKLPAAKDYPPTHPLCRRLYEWKAEAEGRSFARLFARIFDESGIVRRLIVSEKGERELTNYLHITELLLEAQGASRRSLQELIGLLARWIDGEVVEGEEGNQQRLESDRDAVQIMTMHASKGLEAKVVFLVGGLASNNQAPTRSFHADEGFAAEYLGEGGKEGERITYVSRNLSKAKGALKKQYDSVKALAGRETRYEAERLLYVALTRAKGRLYLPFYSWGDTPQPLTGNYAAVDDRLRLLMEEESFLARISREVIDCTQPLPQMEHAAAAPGLESWEPKQEREEAADREEELAKLRSLHRGYRITSYTEMKPGGAPAPSYDPEREDFIGEALRSIHVSADELPGGAATGIFLHEVLALVPQEVALAAPSAEEFAEEPEVKRILSREAERAGFDPTLLPQAAGLVFTSLRAKLQLRDGRILEGIAAAPRLVREMEFLFPIPEQSHPRLDEALRGRDGIERGGGGGAGLETLPIHRGFVKGFVDILFEHDGLAYFGDWKSDVLPDYTEGEIRRRVEQSYELQAKLYCLALVKMLELRDEAAYEERFGGFLYLFIRGMHLDGAGGEAVHFERPSWSELLGWERELLEREDLEGAA